MHPATEFKKLQEFETLCRQRGLPLTVQRHTILAEIADRKDHPTAGQVFDAVRDRIPGLSRTTVYRVLNMLVRFGIIQKIYQPGAASRFDPKTHQHHHFACLHCDRVIDIEDERLRGTPLPQLHHRGFEISESHMYFRGTCPQCGRKLAKTGRGISKTAERRRHRSAQRKRKAPSTSRQRGQQAI